MSPADKGFVETDLDDGSTSFDPGLVYDGLCDDVRLEDVSRKVFKSVDDLILLCEEGLDKMADLDRKDDGQFADDVDEHRFKMLRALVECALNSGLERWKVANKDFANT